MKFVRFTCLFVSLLVVPMVAQVNRVAHVNPPNKFHDGAMQVPSQAKYPITTPAGPVIFLPAVDYRTGGFNSSSVAAADLNGDGYLDLVVTNSCETTLCSQGGGVSVLLGNGDGTFQAPVSYNSGGFYAAFVVIADVNGDGHPDLAVVNNCLSSTGCGAAGVSVFLNDGHGAFHTPLVLNSGGFEGESNVYQWAGVADINGDGKPDLLVANECIANCVDGGVTVFLGNGDGTFKPAAVYDAGAFSNSGLSAALADVNGDGKLDLVVNAAGKINILLGNGDGTFQPPVEQSQMGGYLSLADLNGDGKIDLAVDLGVFGVNVLLGKGDGTFQARNYHDSQNSPSVVAFGDINGDGHPDMIVASECIDVTCDNVTGGVSVLINHGDGTFAHAVTYNSGGRYANFASIGDVNGDGKPDLLVANGNFSGSSGMAVLLNNYGAPSTTTSLVSSVNPVAPGQPVTYTATVTTLSGGTLNGSIAFHDGGPTVASVPLTNNKATYTTSYTKNGTHYLAAVYPGVLNIAAGSQSATLTECVPPGSKTVVTTSGSPSLVGQPVTFTATVTPKSGTVPNGEKVEFYSGTTFLATVAVANDSASYTTSTLSGTTHVIRAVYAGDCAIGPSKGSVTQVVDLYSTKTTLRSSPNPSTSGQAVTLTATVSSGAPGGATGKVTFKNGTTTLGTSNLSSGKGVVTTTKLPIGTLTLTASYNGDAQSAKSSGTTTHTVN